MAMGGGMGQADWRSFAFGHYLWQSAGVSSAPGQMDITALNTPKLFRRCTAGMAPQNLPDSPIGFMGTGQKPRFLCPFPELIQSRY